MYVLVYVLVCHTYYYVVMVYSNDASLVIYLCVIVILFPTITAYFSACSDLDCLHRQIHWRHMTHHMSRFSHVGLRGIQSKRSRDKMFSTEAISKVCNQDSMQTSLVFLYRVVSLYIGVSEKAQAPVK